MCIQPSAGGRPLLRTGPGSFPALQSTPPSPPWPASPLPARALPLRPWNALIQLLTQCPLSTSQASTLPPPGSLPDCLRPLQQKPSCTLCYLFAFPCLTLHLGLESVSLVAWGLTSMPCGTVHHMKERPVGVRIPTQSPAKLHLGLIQGGRMEGVEGVVGSHCGSLGGGGDRPSDQTSLAVCPQATPHPVSAPSLPAHCREVAAVGGSLAGRQASANTFKSEVTDKAIYGDSLASDHFPQGSGVPQPLLLASPSRRSLNHRLRAVAQDPGAGLVGASRQPKGRGLDCDSLRRGRRR